MTARLQMGAPPNTRWRDASRGGLALLAILVLVIGVPIGLAVWVGWPLPHGIPSPSEVSDALRDSDIPDSVLVKALALICWIIWIELVVSLLLEGIAAARGRRADHIPMAGGVQKFAARLVAAVVLLAVLAPGRGTGVKPTQSALQLRPQDAVVTLVDQSASDGWGTEWSGNGGDQAVSADTLITGVGNPVYEVQRRDTLWDIAERHLGDPFRWPEIYELNKDVPQPDGTVLTNPDLIYVGWQLKLPADAVGLVGFVAPTQAPATPAPPVVPAADETPPSDPDVMRVVDDGVPAAKSDYDVPVVPASTGDSETMVVVPKEAPEEPAIVTEPALDGAAAPPQHDPADR